MTKFQTLILVPLMPCIFYCNQSKRNQEKKVIHDSLNLSTNIKINHHDTIPELMAKALINDTLEYDSWKPFIFFKSGKFLSTTKKNAVLVTCPTDTTYTIKLYSVVHNKWQLSDSVTQLDAYPIFFVPVYDDYNFDGQTDIYIQVNNSNGYCLSRGNLIIIDPLTENLEVHKEARNLANMKPNKETHSVISEELIWCNSNGFKEIGIWTNKWVNGVLKTMKKKYPCEPQK